MDKPLIGKPRLAKAILELAHKEGAVLFGDFTLSSGKRSDHYWDGKKVTLHPDGAYLVGKAIFDLVADLNIDAIGGLEVGAIPVATAVALVSAQERKPIPAFIVRKNPKEYGTRNEIEGFVSPDGSRVVIVDDVVTSGDSIQKAIKAVEQRGGKVVRIITLVDRHEGGSEKLRSQGYAFESLLDFQQVKGKTILGESKTTGSGLKGGLLC
jgi:orotate phosphoribosyltransferase